MSRGAKTATVRFYFDADVLGLAPVVAGVRGDCTYPGDAGAVIHKRLRSPCPIARDAPDTEWIPRVTEAGWLIVTRDNRIHHRRAELAAVRDAGARMVALSGKEAGNVWAQLEVLLSRWRSIEALLDLPGPFVHRATRSGLSPVDLG